MNKTTLIFKRKRRLHSFVYCAVIIFGILILIPAPAYAPYNMYGAIAIDFVDRNTRIIWGGSYDCLTEQDAWNRAIENCRRNGGINNPRVVLPFRNAAGAIVIWNGTGYAVDWGKNAHEAVEKAKKMAVRYGARDGTKLYVAWIRNSNVPVSTGYIWGTYEEILKLQRSVPTPRESINYIGFIEGKSGINSLVRQQTRIRGFGDSREENVWIPFNFSFSGGNQITRAAIIWIMKPTSFLGRRTTVKVMLKGASGNANDIYAGWWLKRNQWNLDYRDITSENDIRNAMRSNYLEGVAQGDVAILKVALLYVKQKVSDNTWKDLLKRAVESYRQQ